MPAAAIAIVLIAAAAHAVWNTVSKYKRGDTVVFVWAYSAASALLFVPIGIVVMVVGNDTLSGHLAIGAVVSAVLHVAYSLSLQAGYDASELGVVYPVARGIGPVLTMVAAIVLLGEHLTAAAVIGALVVVAGIMVGTGNPFGGNKNQPARGVAWGMTTGIAIASYTLWDSYCVTTLHLSPFTYYAATMLLEALILTPGALRRRSEIAPVLRDNTAPIATIAVLSPIAYILVLVAMQHAPVALVAPLRESSIVIGSLLAWRLFGESHLPRRIVGAAVVLTGIAAISF
ncbi:DMT family transporter [Gordonia jinhuaensis]|uniref:Membrane protein n=1 Tax=Gordonia jinhuaensis TaxID=1517702 RepID=A0A916T7V2_9ACTN|nr:DMT family transporter [Gordonia jinhuaensis]GGB34948.1 membrane protein [Gordonia jinhuaensis]